MVRLHGRAPIQLHPGGGTSERITIEDNDVRDCWAFINAAGSGHVIARNKLTNVGKLYAYSFSGPVTIT